MAYMVFYDEMLIDLAYQLIREKSNMDDVKAAEDLRILDTILSGIQTCFNPWDVDERLRKEYETIELLENIQDNFCYNDGRMANRILDEKDRIINNLKSDRIGVIADVLMKHAKIKRVDELYRRIIDDWCCDNKMTTLFSQTPSN